MATWCAASAILMELSSYLKRMETKAEVEWTPRTVHREADVDGDATSSITASRFPVVPGD